MGENEGSGLLASGLLPNAGLLVPFLDMERWAKAEERTAELIACIQPNPPSEERRNAVAYYVQRLIMKCFPCQVFTFGSVPLKTYLPDGDIDLTAFSYNESLKDTWANEVRDMLENEEKNENAEFHVKEVQYIQAEVKIIKCLVENIVVDISFNQLGGLCTLCFLEEVDHLINQNHLFKRSIILIKAWCYYESRILGAHHGLISTYGLETLVLYIFHIYNNSFAGPLEVLFRFLEFFSNFDWENFCVSLWGPVPIISLPDITVEPPRKDNGELLLSKMFLDTCSYRYAVFPSGQENQGQGFTAKHLNVIDPLRINNNLGRSVSKGNFFRIRSAFAFGTKRLARLLSCPEENLVYEVNQFFLNTWERHGSGHRPDAPKTDLWPSTLDNSAISNNTSVHEAEVEVIRVKNPPESLSDKGQKSLKLDQGKFLFARTRSSPELTETYSEVSSRRRGDTQTTASTDPKSELLPNHNEALPSPVGAQGMQQEEQDLVNMMGFNNQVHMPMNLASPHLPFPISMGYGPRIVPTNMPFIDPNMHFPHGMVSPMLSHYFSSVGMASHSEDSREADQELWQEQDAGFESEKSNQQRYTKDKRDNFQYPDEYADERTSSRFSLRSKTSSESSWDEPKEKRGSGKGKITSEQEDDQDYMGTETAKRTSGYEQAQTSGSDSMVPIPPIIVGPANRQRTMENTGGTIPFAFYPTGPPVPFLTMLPFYNMRPDAGNSDASTSRYTGDEGPNSIDDDVNSVGSSRGAASVGTFEEYKSDILRSDLPSHWQNLQLGRFCQNPRPPGPIVHPSPTYIQGRFPLDGSGRPISGNMNFVTQLMSYGHHLVPVAPFQSVANRPPNGYQRYDDMPRYRSGTGTYLPNPKVPVRDRHSSGARRGNYNYDRNDNHGDREGNWNNSKTRSSGRGHNRNQNDKSGSRPDRYSGNENRSERSWTTYRQPPFPSYQTQNGPTQNGPHNMAYGMYPVQAMNPGGMSSNGSTVVMLYPVDHNSGYGVHGGQLEFGSLGQVGFANTNEQAQMGDGTRVRGEFEEYRFHGGSAQRSPEQPSSPHHQRRV